MSKENEKIKSLLQVVGEFSLPQIDEDNLEMSNPQANDDPELNSKIADHDIIQLSNNFIPKGLIPLEKLFDYNDVPRNPTSISPEDENEEIIIEPKNKCKILNSPHFKALDEVF